ncbi:MAG TPA: hypothetical protein VIJ35_00340 [Bradyrhizobium sp.]
MTGRNGPAVHDAAGYSEPLQIELVSTDDDDIGQRPPLGDGVWHAVHSADGRTLWRRIYLE